MLAQGPRRRGCRISGSISTASRRAADLVLEVTRATYPDLDIPFHARWRHFVLGGADRWAARRRHGGMARPRGAGPRRIRSRDRQRAARCRRRAGVALSRCRDRAATSAARKGSRSRASRMFEAGAFSARPGDPLRADAARAGNRYADETLAAGFQASDDNPLVGLDGRADAAAPARRARSPPAPDVFARADAPRPGGLFDHLAGARRRPADRGRRASSRAARPSRADLAVADHARRHRRSATPGAIRRSGATTPTDGWCRSTSCRNGSPIR